MSVCLWSIRHQDGIQKHLETFEDLSPKPNPLKNENDHELCIFHVMQWWQEIKGQDKLLPKSQGGGTLKSYILGRDLEIRHGWKISLATLFKWQQ